jgi:hypothetical protein
MDQFPAELEKAKKLRNELLSYLEEREDSLRNGKSTGRIDSKLRGGLQQFPVYIDFLRNELNSISKDPGRYKVSGNELQRRKAIIDDLEQSLSDIETKSLQGPSGPKGLGVGVNFKRDAGESETSDTRNLSNQDLKITQKKMIEKQDEDIEKLIGTSENLFYVAKEIGDEVDLHNKLLDDVERNVEHQNQRIENSTFKMKELIAKSNDGCMLCCIVLLIVGIVLVLVLL